MDTAIGACGFTGFGTMCRLVPVLTGVADVHSTRFPSSTLLPFFFLGSLIKTE